MTDFELESVFEMMNSKLTGVMDAMGNRSAKCPLALWQHSKGKDQHPSLRAKSGDPAVYRCFGCHTEGTIFTLAKTYSEFSGDYRAIDYIKSITKSNFWGRTWESGIKYKRIGKKIQDAVKSELTEDKLKKYMTLVPNYAFQRGITKQQVLRWEIGFDPDENRMIFTVRDHCGKLVGVSGRDVTGERKPKYKHYPGFRKEKVLYGERFLDRNVKRAYLVEGFMDVLALERFGMKNAMATMGTSLSDTQDQKLQRWFREVVFIPDVDDQGDGIKFVHIYGERLAMHGVKVGVAGCVENPEFIARDRPRQWEPTDFRFHPIDALKEKDPADLMKSELDEVLNQTFWITLKAREHRPLFT